MFLDDCQCRVSLHMQAQNDCPIFYINLSCFMSLDHFTKMYDSQISDFFKSDGNLHKYMQIVSSNVELLCILQKTRFKTDEFRSDEYCTNFIFERNNEAVVEFNFIRDEMILTNRKMKKLPIIFSIFYKNHKWYFCDSFCYVTTEDGVQYCLYLN